MTAANEYAKALFLLAEESGKTEKILEDAALLARILKENPDYIKLLDTPAVVKGEKIALIDAALGSIEEYLLNLVKILCEEHSVHILPSVLSALRSIYNEARGIEEVEAVSAIPMSDEQIEKMTKKLEAMTGKKIILKNTVDKTILGGVKLRYLGVQLDGSVKTRLDKFSQALKNTVI